MNLVEVIRAARENGDPAAFARAIPYMSALDIRVEAAGGTVVLLLPAREMHVGNPWLPALHGGCIGGFLETAAIVQLILDQDGDTLPKPINITVDYLRSGRVVDTRAEARVTRLGRRVANVHAACWQDDRERPIATLQGHFLMT